MHECMTDTMFVHSWHSPGDAATGRRRFGSRGDAENAARAALHRFAIEPFDEAQPFLRDLRVSAGPDSCFRLAKRAGEVPPGATFRGFRRSDLESSMAADAAPREGAWLE